MDVGTSDCNEEQLHSANEIVDEIEEHMFNLEELNILGVKEDRNIVSNLMEGVEIESPTESLHTEVQATSPGGDVMVVAEKSANDNSENSTMIRKCITEPVVNELKETDVVECISKSNEEECVVRNESESFERNEEDSEERNEEASVGSHEEENVERNKEETVERNEDFVEKSVEKSVDMHVEESLERNEGCVEKNEDESVEKQLEKSVERNVVLANVDAILASDEGNSSSLPSVSRGEEEMEVDTPEISKDVSVEEVDSCKDMAVSEISQSGDEVVEMEQDQSFDAIQLDQNKDDEVVLIDQGNKEEGSPAEKGRAVVKETEAVTLSENTTGIEDVSLSSVSEAVNTPVSEDQQSNEKRNDEEDMIQVIKQVVEPSREKIRRKRSTSLHMLNTSGNSTSTHEDEDLEDSTSGRPRRKAAQIAGNQIKQIVNSEDELEVEREVKVADKKKDAEETGTYPRMICYQCCRFRSCQYHLLVDGVSRYMCSTSCFQAFRKSHSNRNIAANRRESELKKPEVMPSVEVGIVGERKTSSTQAAKVKDKEHVLICAFCDSKLEPISKNENILSWETMEFCNEDCLSKYQDQLGSNCSQCKLPVQRASMGKYCVRFGYNIKQFCCSTCLEEFKKGLKSCTYCQKDISSGAEGFLAPVGDKGQFKDFCSPACMEKYDHISSGTRPPIKVNSCAVCNKPRPVFVELIAGKLSKDIPAASKADTSVYGLCSEPCFAAFKYVNQLKTEQCESCMRQFDTSLPDEKTATFFHDSGYHCCCRACLNVYILTHRRIVQCNWCRVKKYDFDMIKRITSSGKILMMCSLNCLNLFQVSITAVSSQRVQCDHCREITNAQYHLTMSDATVRNFCTYDCVMAYQARYNRMPLTLPDESVDSGRLISQAAVDVPAVPVISSVQSLAPSESIVPTDSGIIPTSLTSVHPESIHQTNRLSESINGMPPRQFIVIPQKPKAVRNKMTSCKPAMVSKSVSSQPSVMDCSTQTDETSKIALVPVPVPIYVPMPMHMYCNPFPIPVPFALPVPVPIVIPSTLAYEEIKKRAQVFESVAPEEAEILMMAELVADEEQENKDPVNVTEPVELPSPSEDSEILVEPGVASDSEGEDKWKTVDLEELIAATSVFGPAYIGEEGDPESEGGTRRARKTSEKIKSSKAKLPHNESLGSGDDEEPTELKADMGVSAWSVWVQQKNSELSKATSNSRRLKLFKTDLLQMNLEELNYALCLFVKEVRKPGGGMYAADTIFYFCLGIQHYLAENGRLDNIFTDLYFEKFTECLDQVALNFPSLTKETSLITTRVLEEHLWESRQLGAHSPYVLLSTLVFFNTKYFHLWTLEDHAKLKFASVVKVMKKGRGRSSAEAAKPGTSGTRALGHSTLRYTHPDSEEKVFEQHENLETPLRCPVKLYEFYLSRCPEPVRRGGDLFYLLPERACVPDSPVWYSSVALGFDALGKILHRIKMVKEICEAYVSDAITS